MLAHLTSLTVFRLWAALLLGAISLQAAGPIRAPLEQEHGSAFAATTYEVALAIQRNERASEREVVVPQPTTATIFAVAPEAAPVAPFPDLAAPRPDSTGPPLRDIRSRQSSPRAPPPA